MFRASDSKQSSISRFKRWCDNKYDMIDRACQLYSFTVFVYPCGIEKLNGSSAQWNRA